MSKSKGVDQSYIRKPVAGKRVLMRIEEIGSEFLEDLDAAVASFDETKYRAKKMSENEEMDQFNIRMPVSFKREFRVFCAEHDVSSKDALLQGLELLKVTYSVAKVGRK